MNREHEVSSALWLVSWQPHLHVLLAHLPCPAVSHSKEIGTAVEGTWARADLRFLKTLPTRSRTCGPGAVMGSPSDADGASVSLPRFPSLLVVPPKFRFAPIIASAFNPQTMPKANSNAIR
jgi:hypothetical protein